MMKHAPQLERSRDRTSRSTVSPHGRFVTVLTALVLLVSVLRLTPLATGCYFAVYLVANLMLLIDLLDDEPCDGRICFSARDYPAHVDRLRIIRHEESMAIRQEPELVQIRVIE